MDAARRVTNVVTLTLVALLLTACGPAPWDPAASGTPTSAPTPSGSATVPTPVPNDLSTGATERELLAGPVSATVGYWSTLSMDKWSAGAVKPISLDMTTTVTPADGQKVYLQRAQMLVVPGTTEGALTPLDPQADQATVAPGYLVLSPYSYSQTFNVGPVPEEATLVSLQFTYDFLVQTTPTSSEYAKQTVTDTITVALSD